MSATSPPGKSLRVLSASADPALAYSRELLLRSQGCEVKTSLSQSEAKALLKSEHFDLLVLGNSLTPKTCRELAKDFRSHNPSGKIIEILSARWHDPMNDPDTTTIGPEELVAAVREWASGAN
jgi:DNA-binding response OmpR family regulator